MKQPECSVRDCACCRAWSVGPALETLLPGLTVLSSSCGSTLGPTGYCALQDRFRVPCSDCPDWQPLGEEPALAR